MTRLYTKNGRPLQVSGSSLYSSSGQYIGEIQGDRVFAPDGNYAGTIVGGRVVYRSTHSARISSPSIRAPRAGSAAAPHAPSAIWGDEPNFPD
ncbi:hypothetical protein HMPREF0591_0331 [Mycobacterium parascrofulaceum ATCC BAA-614]|uniref:Uncharacterized protein n=1 Tax=Mycobacterium parascrofulaceum ATCC BAA-614 TaxID=525368 RepID=D5P2D7_9MYCO|nr:hypothetical protein HMPREF0591_0331 [Mycobacterium parascrofulaceum ATCC BAA-614]